MTDQADVEFRRKASLDLWLHQNTLFWTRFNLLYLIQGSFFLMVKESSNSKRLIWIVLGITALLMVWLYLTVRKDRLLRNLNANRLKNDFRFDPLPDGIASGGMSARFLENFFEISVFAMIFALDLAWVLLR